MSSTAPSTVAVAAPTECVEAAAGAPGAAVPAPAIAGAALPVAYAAALVPVAGAAALVPLAEAAARVAFTYAGSSAPAAEAAASAPAEEAAAWAPAKEAAASAPAEEAAASAPSASGAVLIPARVAAYTAAYAAAAVAAAARQRQPVLHFNPALTPEEKEIVINVYQYVTRVWPEAGNSYRHCTEKIAEITGLDKTEVYGFIRDRRMARPVELPMNLAAAWERMYRFNNEAESEVFLPEDIDLEKELEESDHCMWVLHRILRHLNNQGRFGPGGEAPPSNDE